MTATPAQTTAVHADDLQFAQRLIRKDETAWSDFFMSYRSFCNGVAYKYNRGHEFDDLFSLLTLKLLGTQGGPAGVLERYDGSAPLKTYVYFVFKNLILNHIRNFQTKNITVDTEMPIEQFAATPAADSAQEEEAAQLAAAVRSLPVRDRRLLELYYYQELTVRQIGQMLDCNASTVSRNLRRVETALKAVLESEPATQQST